MLYFFLVLILLVAIYTRRRRPQTYLVPTDLDDDVRENIINYDEEGVGQYCFDTYFVCILKYHNLYLTLFHQCES